MVTRRGLAFAVLAAGTTAAIVLAACGLDLEGTKGATPGEDARDETSLPPDGPDGGPEADAPTDGPNPNLPCLGLPGMIQSPDGGFCIDGTEVTNAQYDEFVKATGGGTDASFLDASSIPGGFAARCAGHTTFAPKGDAGGPNLPVAYVDWCDAFAYCQWASKRLCTGRTDGDAGEWELACTLDGTRKLPYGDTPMPGHCNVDTAPTPPAGAPKEVGTSPLCAGGYDGGRDMVGNVREWVDECVAGKCKIYGGSFVDLQATTTCGSSFEVSSSSYRQPSAGFRCCR